MFEGKEVSGKLPAGLGDYGIDIKEAGSVDAEVAVNADKVLFGGLVKIRGSMAGIVTIDAKVGLLKLVGDSENFFAKLLVSALKALPSEPAPATPPPVV